MTATTTLTLATATETTHAAAIGLRLTRRVLNADKTEPFDVVLPAPRWLRRSPGGSYILPEAPESTPRHRALMAPAVGAIRVSPDAAAKLWESVAQAPFCGADLSAYIAESNQGGFEHNVAMGGGARFWLGAFTPGRWLAVYPSGRGFTVQWNTGTGRPSTWIGSALQRAGVGVAVDDLPPRRLSRDELRGLASR